MGNNLSSKRFHRTDGQGSVTEGKTFERFIVVALGTPDLFSDIRKQPYIASLLAKEDDEVYGVVGLNNYRAVALSRKANYVAMISDKGEFKADMGEKDAQTVVDLLEKKNISWKVYVEDYGGVGDERKDLYLEKYNPFHALHSIRSNPARFSRIVPAEELQKDIEANNVPQFVYYIPNADNAGHRMNNAHVDNWLRGFLEPKLIRPEFTANTAILVTFAKPRPFTPHRKMFSMLLGGAIKRGGAKRDNNIYSHCSILKTLTDNWELGELCEDVYVNANPFLIKESKELKDRDIKHVVVVVMENRSFDKMYGYYKSETAGEVVRGLTGKEYNHVRADDTTSAKIFATPDAIYNDKDDPDHEVEGTHLQITGRALGEEISDKKPKKSIPSMSGFVQNFSQAHNIPETDLKRLGAAMNAFAPEKLPVSIALAQEFALFDAWFSSIPGPTIPNRLYIHSGTSHGENRTNDTMMHVIKGYPQRTFYQDLDDSKVSWASYFHNYPSLIEFGKLRTPSTLFKNIKPFKAFLEAAKEGTLPNYTFIDPAYFDMPFKTVKQNDNHPPADCLYGERFLKRVYEALRNGPGWMNTLLIITYDEHGGYYDHVQPPSDGVPNPDGITSPNCNFESLGVRVPTIVVSPWVKKGRVVHEPKIKPTETSQFEHSSIIATTRKIFGLAPKPLTRREKWAGTFEDILLELHSPRTDTPEYLPEVPVALFEAEEQNKPGPRRLKKVFQSFGRKLVVRFWTGYSDA